MPKKKKNIYKRSDGRFEGRILFINSIGEKKYKYVYGKTKKEVREKMKAKKDELISSCNINFNLSAVAKKMISVKKNCWSKYTFDKYLTIIENRIIPNLGQYNIYEVNDTIKKEFTNSLKAEGLSVSTINTITQLLNSIITFYDITETDLKHETISKNIKILTQTQLLDFINFLCNNITDYNLGILIAICTGIKPNELCALKWNDVNFEDSTITIHKSIKRVKSNDGESKTEVIIEDVSERTVYLPTKITEVLRANRKNNKCFITSGSVNKYTDFRTMQNVLTRIVNCFDNNLTLNFTCIRDSFAVHSIQSGIDIRVISGNMGISLSQLEKYFIISTYDEEKSKTEINKFIDL